MRIIYARGMNMRVYSGGRGGVGTQKKRKTLSRGSRAFKVLSHLAGLFTPGAAVSHGFLRWRCDLMLNKFHYAACIMH